VVVKTKHFLSTNYTIYKAKPSSVVQRLACLPLDLQFAGSNPDAGDKFLRLIKINNTPYFGGEVKPEVPCRKILHHVKKLLSMNKDTSYGQINHFIRQFPQHYY
jgi:hypothetical protein